MNVLTHYRGDTWKGLTFTTRWNGGTPPVAAASVRMQFRLFNKTCDVEIEIVDAVEWTFTAPQQKLDDVNVDGIWDWDVEVTDTVGDVTTTAKGYLRVEADVTQ